MLNNEGHKHYFYMEMDVNLIFDYRASCIWLMHQWKIKPNFFDFIVTMPPSILHPQWSPSLFDLFTGKLFLLSKLPSFWANFFVSIKMDLRIFTIIFLMKFLKKKVISTVLNISLLFRFSSLPLACGFSAAPSTPSFMASWTATSDLSTRECSMISLVLLVLRERSRQVKAKICPAREIIQHESIQIFKKKAFIFPWVSLCRSAQVNLS